MFRWVVVSPINGEVVAGFNDIEMFRLFWESLNPKQRLALEPYDTIQSDRS